jgi:hypothetical protein
MRIHALLAIATTLLAAGCASTPRPYETGYRSDGADSRAMSVVKANDEVSLTHPDQGSIRDMPNPGTAQHPGAGGAGSVGYAVANAIAPPPGIGGGMALGMSAVALFMPGPYDPLSGSHVIAWMPRELAPTQRQARDKMTDLLAESLALAAKEVIGDPYRFEVKRLPVPGRDAEEVDVVITGGDCVKKVSCGYRMSVWREPRAGISPDFLGGGDAWMWPHRGSSDSGGATTLYVGAFDNRQMGGKPRDWFADFSLYRQMSAELPGWVFIYLAPGDKVSLGPDKGFLKTPLILNQGKVLEFVKPAGVAAK